MKKLQKTVFGIVLSLMAGMCPAVWAQDAEDAQGTEKDEAQWTPCSQWNDTALRIAFPREIGGLTMQERSVQSRSDTVYELRYLPSDYQRRPKACRLGWLDIIIRKAGVSRSSDGTDEEEEFPNGASLLARRWFDGFMQAFREQDVPVTDIAEGAFPHVGQKYLWSSRSYSNCLDDIVAPYREINLVTAFNRGIVHLCYTAPFAEHLETSDTFKTVLDAVGRMFKESVEASAVDVYAIADPKAALAAVRRKWPGAADRISMWEMPKHAKTFFEIDSLQDWCNDDPPNRYRHLEQASKRAVDLRIEPPIWYYNLACARAVQGRTDAAFEALEQATAAGLGVWTSFGDDISRDADFASITNDSRFAKLCAMMRADERQSWKMPRKFATEVGGVLDLTDNNVYWGFKKESFWVRLKTTNECPIVYVNRHVDHPQTPCDGLISVRYPQEAVEARCNEGPANIYVTRRSDSVPTIIAGDPWLADDRLNRPMSVPALLAVDDWLVENLGQGVVGLYPAFLECDHAFGRNVLGVHAVGSDYGSDGVDRFLGHQPIGIAHVGGAEESDKFVRLAADAIRALPKDLREKAAYIVPNLIRRGQKCVMSETDFMSGRAWRPALRFADIDCAKVLAQTEKSAALPLVPVLKSGFTLCGIYGNTNREWRILGTDFHERPFNRLVAGGSPIHLAVVARTMARTVCIDKLSVTKTNPRGDLVWKVLQGDPQKVRVATAEDGRVTIEVDYHVPFDVAWGDGAKIRTSRVDVGCFCVVDGVASTPAIVSVYFSPNETRTYDADGHIVSVDYTKSWIKEFCPTFCARGDWKDAYQWTDDGQLLGWTRTYVPEAQAMLAAGRFGVVTNVFTRDGFVIDSRDALGRPQNVHRSMRATWAQKLDTAMLYRPPADRLVKDYAPMEFENFAFDFNEGFSERMVLAWNYTYENAEDRFGTAKPRPMAAYSYDPAVCPRADFADETTGFRLPLLEQVERGYETYVGYKRDIVGGRIRDVLLQRPDSYHGVVDSSILPQTLKKMRFCAWSPSTNDVWTVDLGTFEQALAKELFQLGEGAYRYARRDANDGTVTPLASVGVTLRSCHGAGMRGASVALKRLGREEWPDADEAGDEIAHRCGLADDFAQLLRDQCLFRDFEWGCLPYRWPLGDGKGHLVILRNASDESADGKFTRRLYRYCLCPDSDGDAENRRMPVAFAQLPSRAIGNTVLRAWEGDPDALNNLAVLLYAGVANPDVYDEKVVIDLLQRAAQKGNAMASFNLDVLYANNGGRTTPNAGTNAVVSATPPTCAVETSDAGTNAVPSGASFDIPLPLRVRMEAAYNIARDKLLAQTERIDICELIGLSKGGMFTNALEIAKRPRGEMAFCDDGLTEAERARLWPFDVEAFERTLERKMVRDAQGCYCLKAAYAEGLGGQGTDGNLAVNPTTRWVNSEVEHWAVGQMDGVFKRVDDKTVCRMYGLEKPVEGMIVWTLDADNGEYFAVLRQEGAWGLRDYIFVLWDGEDGSAIPLADFTTFPTRREAMTFRSRTGAAVNNLAVLEWRHRVNQYFMDPRMIATLLGKAHGSGVPTALANLKVLFDHIPEVADFVTE